MLSRDIGTRTGAIIHNDGGTAQFTRQRFAERPREEIAGATWWEADDKPDGPAHGPCRAGLRRRLPGRGECHGCGEEGSAVEHGFLPVAFCWALK